MMSEVQSIQSFEIESSSMKKKEEDVERTHLSPRVSSPLTPPATGDSKLEQTNEGSNNSNIEEGKFVPKDLSHSPTTAKRRLTRQTQQISYPVRDSPLNPFLQGCPADAGLSGPRKWYAKQRIAKIPKREPGKMTYVFRGQRVTYAEPFASDDSDEDELSSTTITSTYLGDGRWRHERVPADRLQPKILFPSATFMASSSSSSSTSKQNSTAKKRFASGTPSSSSPRKANLFEDVTNYKKRKIETQYNQNLLRRLDHASWASDGEDEEEMEMEKMEEDEVNISMLSEENKRQPQEYQNIKYSKSFDRYVSSDEGISEDEEDEVEENPFLDVASSSSVSASQESEYHNNADGYNMQSTKSQIRTNLFNSLNLSSQQYYSSQATSSSSSSSTSYRHPFAHRPRGHAHSLAHSMHVPGHLRGKRF